jgi:thioredoxin reductase (NADPH)
VADEHDRKVADTVIGGRGEEISTVLRPRLSDQHLAALTPLGQVRPTVAGEVLFQEGDRSYDFIVIMSGQVAIVDHESGVERELVSGGPREFLAELNLLTGERLFTTAVVTAPGTVLVVPVARLQALISRDQALGRR